MLNDQKMIQRHTTIIYHIIYAMLNEHTMLNEHIMLNQHLMLNEHKIVNEHVQQTFLGPQDVLNMSSRHILKTSSKCLQCNNLLSWKTF